MNNKPWVRQSLKQVLMKKHNAFHNGKDGEKTGKKNHWEIAVQNRFVDIFQMSFDREEFRRYGRNFPSAERQHYKEFK